ncbi:MAG: asparagine synthase (glutamine-hydrolyzing) [Anaerolineae bacterium]
MCGLAGIVRFDGIPPDLTLLDAMTRSIRHRGPDGAGVVQQSLPGGTHVSLVHTRLAVIDLSDAGKQPMSNEDQSLFIAYNGEVYNFRELRGRLMGLGYHFFSQTDTEVVLKAHQEWQAASFNLLNGMFAFAILDVKRGRLILCRDRMGIKPLYYYVDNRHLVFASEIKTILVDPEVPREPEVTAVNEFLMFRSLSGERTLFKDIRTLPPGCFLVWEAGRGVRVSRYWELESAGSTIRGPFSDGIQQLEELLRDSVDKQLISDVPLGIQLSGGVDSSLITAIASQSHGLDTFSVDFKENDFSERQYIENIVERYHTNHHHFYMKNGEFPGHIERLIWHLDEPLYHPHLVPLYILCREAKKRVTVLLAGEGADELFAGYYWYIKALLTQLIKDRVPSYWASLSASVCSRVTPRAARIIRNAHSRDWPWLIINLHAFQSHEQLAEVVTPEFLRPYEEIVAERYSALHAKDSILEKALYLDQITHLQALLVRQDKMSMASGVETRVPFLDHRIVSLAWGMPGGWKVRHFRGKHILKKLAEKYMPKENIYRKKVGFWVPIGAWFRRNDGLGECLSILNEPRTLQRGVYRRETVLRLVEEHRTGQTDHSESRLWGLLNLELWMRCFMDWQSAFDVTRDVFHCRHTEFS